MRQYGLLKLRKVLKARFRKSKTASYFIVKILVIQEGNKDYKEKYLAQNEEQMSQVSQDENNWKKASSLKTNNQKLAYIQLLKSQVILGQEIYHSILKLQSAYLKQQLVSRQCVVVLNKQKPYLTSRRIKDKFICEGATCQELGVSTDIFFRMLTLYVLGVERERIWELDKRHNLTQLLQEYTS